MKKLKTTIIIISTICSVQLGLLSSPKICSAEITTTPYIAYYMFKFTSIPPKNYRGMRLYHYEYDAKDKKYIGWYGG